MRRKIEVIICRALEAYYGRAFQKRPGSLAPVPARRSRWEWKKRLALFTPPPKIIAGRGSGLKLPGAR